MSSESRIEIRLPNIDFQDNLEVEMIYIVIALCALVTAFFACRYYAAKILLVEYDIDKAIARKFESSGKAIELAKLREENAVMRNLLLDLLENEVAFPVQQATVSVDDLFRMKATKIQRYREILAESRHVLQQREASRVSGLSSSLKSTERRM
ncbi:hypothetical protein AT5A_20291 [Agrobacterium tumefaciens 5A]|uniref:Uncharacterized protein n=2 Tax=Agrobacterium tumefaciens TaxID=358 RepID=A0AAJ4N793_AGRTU|nr:hypothetical protein AT5A_20291 [Agrobacterium tumefaciens 5A]NSY61929.1 hypothetical protein [Agrobacterium tumefaciens]NTA84389.1 hypothetical protein [Agrobacterium tumefaciens]QTG16519.1 hypothetical protein G6M86_24750 [Agrobacterium tumefaciens]